MSWITDQWRNGREERRHADPGGVDQRRAFERDRDRILYSSALRRLAGVTQVVRVAESDVFHNRLTHSIKVAQLGRRLAQHLLRADEVLCTELCVDPEVVEAACLAHDIGHPPFGHLGEQALNRLLTKAGEADGFEGNAQSIRILTKLAIRLESEDGLNLTRATLAAVLKYPWFRDKDSPARSKKWSAYRSEEEDFAWARAGLSGTQKTAEAELMDWADDIAYSVHDAEDFTRVRLIPWATIEASADELIATAAEAWFQAPEDATAQLGVALEEVLGLVPTVIREPYEGRRDQRQELRMWTSAMISHFFTATKLRSPEGGSSCLEIDDTAVAQMTILKQMTRHFVIRSPALRAQQRGQDRIIQEVFEDLLCDLTSDSRPAYFPMKDRHLLDIHGISQARAVADCIASLTEGELISLHARLRGRAGGSVLDPIVR